MKWQQNLFSEQENPSEKGRICRGQGEKWDKSLCIFLSLFPLLLAFRQLKQNQRDSHGRIWARAIRNVDLVAHLTSKCVLPFLCSCQLCFSMWVWSRQTEGSNERYSWQAHSQEFFPPPLPCWSTVQPRRCVSAPARQALPSTWV